MRLLTGSSLVPALGALLLVVGACSDSSEPSTTTTQAAASTTSTVPSTTTSSSTTSSTTTSTSTSTTTTTAPVGELALGSWAAVDADGSTISAVFGDGEVFESYDRSSTTCEESPWSWVGGWSSDDSTTVTVVGDTTCYPVGGESQTRNEGIENDFEYVRDVDAVVFTPDGTTFTRTDDTIAGVWHRLSGGTHEITLCSSGSSAVECSMVLGLGSPDAVVGEFAGSIIEDCESFDTSICEEATMVVKGVAAISQPDGAPIGSVDQLLVVQPDGMLVVQWTDTLSGLPDAPVPFHCPWYRTWADAQSLPGECTFG